MWRMFAWLLGDVGLSYTDRMKLLALDTSTERLCVALCTGDQVGVHEEPGGPQASQRLLPAAQALLQQLGLQWSDLHGLAYAQGPGAFTGLRGACAAVQGLALGLGVPAVAVPSLRIVAQAARQDAVRQGLLQPGQTCTAWVAMDARMGQVYDDLARWDGQRWHEVRGPVVREPVQACAQWLDDFDSAGHALKGGADAPAILFAGSGLGLMPPDGAEKLRATGMLWMDQELGRGAALAQLAMAAWELGPRLDAAHVMPLYVRDRVALTTAERERAAQATTASQTELARPSEPVGPAR
jgi:tRNA threonylcarbamoyladenosine biosynthesis protein TsaB